MHLIRGKTSRRKASWRKWAGRTAGVWENGGKRVGEVEELTTWCISQKGLFPVVRHYQLGNDLKHLGKGSNMCFLLWVGGKLPSLNVSLLRQAVYSTNRVKNQGYDPASVVTSGSLKRLHPGRVRLTDQGPEHLDSPLALPGRIHMPLSS